MASINKVASASILNFDAAPEKPTGTELEDFHRFLDVVVLRMKKIGKNPKIFTKSG